MAAAAPDLRVVLVTKGRGRASGATFYVDRLVEFAALSVAAPGAWREDSPELHHTDLDRYGSRLTLPQLGGEFTRRAWDELHWLEESGVVFESHEGVPVRVQLPGHSAPRSLRADRLGEAIIGKGLAQAQAQGLEVRQRCLVEHLARVEGGFAVELLDLATGAVESMATRAVIVATGGIGALYGLSTNPPGASGDGIALALAAGARLLNMEFVQYLPLVVAPVRGLYLISSVLREGLLHSDRGQRYAPGEPRGRFEEVPGSATDICFWMDAVRRLEPGTRFWWDGSHLGETLEARMPRSCTALRRKGVDLKTAPVEMAPGGHHALGGICIAADGATGVPGLFAAGEVAGGVQGAARIMGSGLMEGLVFGAAAGAAAGAHARAHAGERVAADESRRRLELGDIRPLLRARRARLQQAMAGALVTKDAQGLKQALATVGAAAERLPSACPVHHPSALLWHEVRSAAVVAEAILQSSLARRESRGLFARRDFPRLDRTLERRHVYVTMRGGQLEAHAPEAPEEREVPV